MHSPPYDIRPIIRYRVFDGCNLVVLVCFQKAGLEIGGQLGKLRGHVRLHPSPQSFGLREVEAFATMHLLNNTPIHTSRVTSHRGSNDQRAAELLELVHGILAFSILAFTLLLVEAGLLPLTPALVGFLRLQFWPWWPVDRVVRITSETS